MDQHLDVDKQPHELHLQVSCDRGAKNACPSPAFLSGVAEQSPNAEVTVDWFHIVQIFKHALGEVRRAESQIKPLPRHPRRAVLKRGNVDQLTANQLHAMAELLDQGLDTATAWRIKERLRRIRLAKIPRVARWRITRFITYAT